LDHEKRTVYLILKFDQALLTNCLLAVSLGQCPAPIVFSGPRMGRDAASREEKSHK